MRGIKIGLLAVAILLFWSAPAFSDSVGRGWSYVVNVPDSNYVFVMIYPLPPEEDALGNPKILEIRNKYEKSGLYKTDDPTHPLWTVDWWASERDILPCPDGVHLVLLSDSSSSMEDVALSFYEKGQLLREYKVSELVLLEAFVPHSISHLRWLEDSKLNCRDLTLALKTKENSSFVFDLKTGDIVTAFRPLNMALGFAFLMLIATFIAIIYRYNNNEKSFKFIRGDISRAKLSLVYFSATIIAYVIAFIPFVHNFDLALSCVSYFSEAYQFYFITFQKFRYYGISVLSFIAICGVESKSKLLLTLYMFLLMLNLIAYMFLVFFAFGYWFVAF